jgi:hypothetical protein
MLVYVVTTLWICTRANLAQRLVIEQNPWPYKMTLQAQQLAVDGDFLAAVNLIPRLRGLAIDADASLLQHGVELAARAGALVGQKLLNSFHREIIQWLRRDQSKNFGIIQPIEKP